jgi:hypothetical protein
MTQTANQLCYYCQKECVSELLNDPVNYPKGAYIDYDCYPCQAYIRLNLQGDIVYARWSNIKIEDKSYFIQVFPPTQFIIYYYSQHQALAIGDWINIKTFAFIPDWTPQNIVNKLGAYLPFL